MTSRVAAVVCAAIALVMSAVIHLSLASQFDAVQAQLENGSVVTVGQYFRASAAVSAVLAILIIVRPRAWSAAIVGVVSLAGLVITVATTVTSIPLPFGLPTIPQGPWLQLRILAAVAEGVALAASLVIGTRPRRR